MVLAGAGACGGVDLLRTPDERFAHLPEYPFAPRYVEFDGARMHYVDEGTGAPILMLHGEPTWSFLYRKMIARLAPAHRCVAPDFLGFGRSDKPARVEDYSAGLHVRSLLHLVEQLDLRDITLVVQDWGGLIGLPAMAEAPDRFARVVIMNTGLPDGTQRMPPAWLVFREFVKRTPSLPIGWLVSRGCTTALTQPVKDAYDAPFPDRSYKAGARAFPQLVPTAPEMEAAAHTRKARAFLQTWERPALVLFSDKDPITRGADRWFRKHVPGAQKEPLLVVRGAGHFLQEDRGEEVADHISAFIGRTPAVG